MALAQIAEDVVKAVVQGLKELPVVGEKIGAKFEAMPWKVEDAFLSLGYVADLAHDMIGRLGPPGAAARNLYYDSLGEKGLMYGELSQLMDPHREFLKAASADRHKLMAQALGSTETWLKGSAESARAQLTPKELEVVGAFRTGVTSLFRAGSTVEQEALKNIPGAKTISEAGPLLEREIANYFPKSYDPELLTEFAEVLKASQRKDVARLGGNISKGLADMLGMSKVERRVDIVKRFAEKYTGGDEFKAADLIDKFIKTKMRARVFGPFEERVLDLPGGFDYRIDAVYDRYINNGSKSVSLYKAFGPRNEVARMLHAQLDDLPLDRETISRYKELFRKSINTITGMGLDGVPSEVPGLSLLRSTLGRSLMAFSSIGNVFQGPYAGMIKTDTKAFLDTMGKMFTAGGREELLKKANDLGVLNRQFGKLFSDFSGEEDFFTRSKWTATENFSRVVAANMELEYLPRLNKLVNSGDAAALREAERLGLKAGVEWTQKDINKAAIRMVAVTQGELSPSFLPLAAQSPVGQWLYQLKRFQLLWWNFTKDHVLKEAYEHNNWVPFMKLVGGGQLFGGITRLAWNAIRGKEDIKKSSFEAFMSNLSYASFLGIMSDAVVGAGTGREGAIKQFASLSSITPIDEAEQGVSAMLRGKPAPAIRFAGRRVVAPLLIQYAPHKIAFAAALFARHYTETLAREVSAYEKEAARQAP